MECGLVVCSFDKKILTNKLAMLNHIHERSIEQPSVLGSVQSLFLAMTMHSRICVRKFTMQICSEQPLTIYYTLFI